MVPSADLAKVAASPERARLDRLADAAAVLAATIATTERLAQQTADLLRDIGDGRVMVGGRDRPDYLSLAEAARRTGRHPDVLRRWCSEGRNPALRLGRAWALSRATVAELARSPRRSPTG
jgi:excisionase family DNA binding protein